MHEMTMPRKSSMGPSCFKKLSVFAKILKNRKISGEIVNLSRKVLLLYEVSEREPG